MIKVTLYSHVKKVVKKKNVVSLKLVIPDGLLVDGPFLDMPYGRGM